MKWQVVTWQVSGGVWFGTEERHLHPVLSGGVGSPLERSWKELTQEHFQLKPESKTIHFEWSLWDLKGNVVMLKTEGKYSLWTSSGK